MNTNMNARTGSGIGSAFLTILFIASILLNAAFLAGCISRTDIFGPGPTDPPPPKPESVYLREIAVSLGLSPSSDKTPGDIVFDIRRVLDDSRQYKGDVLDDSSFEECKNAILTSKDTKIFEAYHSFIKKIAGKRIVILECDE
ncbi:MAG: hypothetical protein ACI4RD_05855 [Kiritimatiellia bacterium]